MTRRAIRGSRRTSNSRICSRGAAWIPRLDSTTSVAAIIRRSSAAFYLLIDPACGALELRLSHYCEHVYAQRAHEGLDGATPRQRFHDDPKPLRFPDDSEGLRKKFEVAVERRVSNDHVVTVDAVDYEMPKGYGGQQVVLRRRLLDGGVNFMHEGRVIDLHRVDPASNAHAKRAKDDAGHNDPQPMPSQSAADMSFERDFGPIVGGDGGFTAPQDNHDADLSGEGLPW